MFFDLFGLEPETIVQFLSRWGICADVRHVRLLLDILILSIPVLLAIYKWLLKPWLENKRWRVRYINQKLSNRYAEYCNGKLQKLYIDTRFQAQAPSIYKDPEESLSVDPTENLLDFYLDKVLITNNPNNDIYVVLGGSGMGKTTFAANLLIRFVKKYSEKTLPYDIFLLSLADTNVFEEIEAIINPSASILILDAMDESSEAMKDYDAYIQQLEKYVDKFRFVIVTCRTQFFSDEDNEPKISKLLNLGSGKGFRRYNKHYISPFTYQEVKLYLKKLYRWHFRKRKRAIDVVMKCQQVMIRPLLLSYIDYFVNTKKSYKSLVDIYEVLIDKWIDREVAILPSEEQNKSRQDLYLLSRICAVNMHEYALNRSGLYIEQADLQELLRTNSLDVNSYNFTGRSLLNRDSHGLWKFAHKSFLEYFLAKEKFETYQININFDVIDLAKRFYDEMCKRELDKFVELGDLDLVKSYEMAQENDQLRILKKTVYDIRHLDGIDSVTTLIIDSKLFNMVVDKLAYSKIYYVKIENYSKGVLDGLNALLGADNIKYISIDGEECSKTFIKNAVKAGKSLLNNGEILNYLKSPDAPFDFKAVSTLRFMINYPYPYISNKI